MRNIWCNWQQGTFCRDIFCNMNRIFRGFCVHVFLRMILKYFATTLARKSVMTWIGCMAFIFYFASFQWFPQQFNNKPWCCTHVTGVEHTTESLHACNRPHSHKYHNASLLDSGRWRQNRHVGWQLQSSNIQGLFSELNVDNWNDNCEANSEAKSPRPLRGLQVDFSLTRNVSCALR